MQKVTDLIKGVSKMLQQIVQFVSCDKRNDGGQFCVLKSSRAAKKTWITFWVFAQLKETII